MNKVSKLKITDVWLLVWTIILLSNDVLAEWYLNSSAQIKHDTNLNNAVLSADSVSDTALVFSANAGRLYQLDDNHRLDVQAIFNSETYDSIHGMDNITAGGSISLRRKWGLGLYAPWSSILFSAANLSYANTVRSGTLYQFKISSGKRLTEKWDVWVDYLFEQRTADHNIAVDQGVSGSVFNLMGNSLKLNSTYAVTSNLYFNFGYQLRFGDIASTILMERPDANYDAVMTAVTADPVFGNTAEVYRLTALSNTLSTSVNLVVTDNLVIDLEYKQLIVYGKGDNHYYKSLPALTFSYSF